MSDHITFFLKTLQCLLHLVQNKNIFLTMAERPSESGTRFCLVLMPTTLPLLTHYHHASLFVIGEGNGNPLQCSCLENPRDGGAWWAAVYGVAQSRTRLKRLSSSSSLFVTPPIFQACSHFKSLFWPFLQPGMKESSSLKLFIWLTFLPSTSLASNVTASISVKTILTALFTVLICFPQVPLPWFSWYPLV